MSRPRTNGRGARMPPPAGGVHSGNREAGFHSRGLSGAGTGSAAAALGPAHGAPRPPQMHPGDRTADASLAPPCKHAATLPFPSRNCRVAWSGPRFTHDKSAPDPTALTVTVNEARWPWCAPRPPLGSPVSSITCRNEPIAGVDPCAMPNTLGTAFRKGLLHGLADDGCNPDDCGGHARPRFPCGARCSVTGNRIAAVSSVALMMAISTAGHLAVALCLSGRAMGTAYVAAHRQVGAALSAPGPSAGDPASRAPCAHLRAQLEKS